MAEEQAIDRPGTGKEDLPAQGSKSAPTDEDEAKEKRGHLVEVLAAVLLGLATLGAAWAAYQSSLWDGEFTVRYDRGAMLVDQGSSSMLFAVQEIQLDGMLWMQETTERTLGTKLNEPARLELADYWRKAMSPDFLAAMDWAEKNGSVPLASPAYIDGRMGESLQLIDEGGREFAEGSEAGEHGDALLLITVFYAVALFFGGMASVLKRFPLQVVFLAFGGAVCIGCTVGLTLIPLA